MEKIQDIKFICQGCNSEVKVKFEKEGIIKVEFCDTCAENHYESGFKDGQDNIFESQS